MLPWSWEIRRGKKGKREKRGKREENWSEDFEKAFCLINFLLRVTLQTYID